MNYAEFLEEASQRDLRIPGEGETADRRVHALLSNEALFQLPFLAMVILVISKGRRKPALPEIGQLVGECIEATLSGFKGTSQHIGWSANLRIRTIKALTFLETSHLAEVTRLARTITVTEQGRAVLDRALLNDGNLANTLRVIERNYRNITAEAQIRLEV